MYFFSIFTVLRFCNSLIGFGVLSKGVKFYILPPKKTLKTSYFFPTKKKKKKKKRSNSCGNTSKAITGGTIFIFLFIRRYDYTYAGFIKSHFIARSKPLAFCLAINLYIARAVTCAANYRKNILKISRGDGAAFIGKRVR